MGPSDGASSRSSSRAISIKSTIALLLAASSLPGAMAQKCISLSGSTACSAFNRSSVSTDPGLVSTFPFLAFISDTKSFDDGLNQYISASYAQLKYQQLLGCSNVNLTNTTGLYARYTTTVLCNALVQNSKKACSLSDENSKPLCADTCAQQAISEQQIVMNKDTCTNPNNRAMDQIRADFTVCSLPSDSLSGNCVVGSQNEPNNCGFANNTVSLCAYCAKSSPNSTDTCCYSSNITRCEGIKLPPQTTLPPLFPSSTPSTSAAAATSAPATSEPGKGLSGGAIAGIVVGSVLGAALLIALIVLLCILLRRRRGSQEGSVFNQPSPSRKAAPGMSYIPMGGDGATQGGVEVLPGGRIARMSALERPSQASIPRDAGIVGGSHTRQRGHDISSSDEYGDSPASHAAGGREPLYPPPLMRRTGSLSSSSVLGRGENPGSPQSLSGGELSSPQGLSSQQSEQLPFFKDYYSQDEIHPNDKVATLWAYQPRAGDEFELERGDMLKVVGIWDDGWATGVRISERAEDWDATRVEQRDSGVSNNSARRAPSPPGSGEIKAFPLVCVCLPEHWRKTVEGDGSGDSSNSGPPPPPAF